MIDCIDGLIVPMAVSPYVRPSALFSNIEGGKLVLRVVRGRDEALRIAAVTRAKTRPERYALVLELIEESLLPERADAPSVTVASPAAGPIIGAIFQVMPKFEALQSLVLREERGLDAFVLPRTPEIASGFGVVRTPDGPRLETFHTRAQAADFLKRHEAHIPAEEMEEADDQFGYSPIGDDAPFAPEAFGGFAAAVAGTCYRLARIVNRQMRGLDP